MARRRHTRGLQAPGRKGGHLIFAKRSEALAAGGTRPHLSRLTELASKLIETGTLPGRHLILLGAALLLPVAFCDVASAQTAPSNPTPAGQSAGSQAAQTSSTTQESNPEAPPPPPSPTGWLGFEQVQYQASSLGNVIIEDTDLGYGFTDHFSADFGLPVLFTRSPFSPVLSHDYYWSGLLGEPYTDLKYTSTYHELNYTSVLTGTIPAGNSDKIYTTGRFGVDWFNHVEEPIGKVIPFVNFGLSNGAVNRFIMPRPYSTARPFETLGFMADGEVGFAYKFSNGFAKGITAAVSAYGLQPGGAQKVFSRYVFPYSSLAGDGHHNRFFDSSFETTPTWVLIDQTLQPTTFSNSKLARDNGFSGSIDITRWHNLDVQLGYTRSMHFDLDVYTATFTFDARELVRSVMPHRLGGGGSGL